MGKCVGHPAFLKTEQLDQYSMSSICTEHYKFFSQIKDNVELHLLSFHSPLELYISIQSSLKTLLGFPIDHCVKVILFPLLLQMNSDSVFWSVPPIHTPQLYKIAWHLSTTKVENIGINKKKNNTVCCRQ